LKCSKQKIQIEYLLKKDSKKIVDINISTLTYQEVLQKIFSLGSKKSSSYICFANAHMAVEARLNAKIRNAVNESYFTTSDGMSVVAAIRLLYKLPQQRSAGMDMINDIIRISAEQQQSIFLFGTSQKNLSLFVNKAQKKFPKLKIVGAISPPFRTFTEDENRQFIEQINNSEANIVLVCLGCPKQELWMKEVSPKINAVMLGIGAAMTLYAKETSRAPVFMQRYCLEWVFRLFQEPKRLWKRYLISNTLFIIYLMGQCFNHLMSILFKRYK
jgi:N-acetylglucosaminyldiphosphoundecaprenol N-acetyl-beta-D-mannosaminyltransferase